MSKAFTLIESLLYMGLFALFILIVSGIFLEVMDLQLTTESLAATEQDGQYVLARVEYDVRRASGITFPEAYGLAGSELVLDMDGLEYEYSVVGENLILSTPTGSGQLNSAGTRVVEFGVEKIGNGGVGAWDTVRIRARLQGRSVEGAGQVEESLFVTTVGMR